VALRHRITPVLPLSELGLIFDYLLLQTNRLIPLQQSISQQPLMRFCQMPKNGTVPTPVKNRFLSVNALSSATKRPLSLTEGGRNYHWKKIITLSSAIRLSAVRIGPVILRHQVTLVMLLSESDEVHG
jgi:hypothetical protein